MSTQISTVLMSESEARECIIALKDTARTAREQILHFEEGEGWRALGYPNMRECLATELGKGQAQAYNLLTAQKVQRQISTAVEKPVTLSTKAAVALSKVDESIRAEVFTAAEIRGPVTAPAIAQVASELDRFGRPKLTGPITKDRQVKMGTKGANRHCPTCTC